VKALIVDALAYGRGARIATRDVIGAGPRTIAGVLESSGIKARIVPVGKFLGEDHVLEDYDVLLVSAMTSDAVAARRAIKIWREKYEGLVLVGGPIASDPEWALRKIGADIAVTGEGEDTLQELLSFGLDQLMEVNLSGVLGVSYRLNGRVVANQLRPVQRREFFLEYRPSVKSIIDYPLFRSARVYVEVLRGCSNYHRARLGPIGQKCVYCESCTEAGLYERYDCPQGIPPGCGYCSVPSLYGPPRTRPHELIVDEVKGLLDLGVRRVVLSAPGFLDYGRDLLVEPDPLTDPRWPEPNYDAVEEILSELTSLEKVEDNLASIMVENLKASLVTERAAKILGEYLQDTTVNIGFETGSEEHSLQLGRPDSPREVLAALKRLRRAGLRPYVYFIHGLPGQSEKTVEETIYAMHEVKGLEAERVIIYRFQSLPRSAFTGCPSGPPSSSNPLSRRLTEAAREVNKAAKDELSGSRIRVVIAEPYDRDQSYTVAYPLKHGPVVLLKGSGWESGDLVDVIIKDTSSDRVVRAEETLGFNYRV
jgi:radical SAM superfamily enzyme YgiQ (UPF0313 family)